MSCLRTAERWNLGRSRCLISFALSFATELLRYWRWHVCHVCVQADQQPHNAKQEKLLPPIGNPCTKCQRKAKASTMRWRVQGSPVALSTIAHFQSLLRIVSARLPRQKSPSYPTMEARSCATQTLISPCSRPPQTISKNSSRFSNVSLSDLAQRYHFPTPDVPCPASPPLRNKSLDTDQIAGKGFMSFSTSSGFIWQHKERS